MTTRWQKQIKKKKKVSVWFNKQTKETEKGKKKKTIVAKTNKLKQMTMKKTKNEIAKDFFVLIFISGFLFSFLPNLRRKHFGGLGEKTPKPYQFSTHKYSQPNMLRKFFSSLVFSLFFFFFSSSLKLGVALGFLFGG